MKKIDLGTERKLLWIGPSLDDVNQFPANVRDAIVTALDVARLGGKHESAKPWKGLGQGIFEIAVDDGDAYRALYTVQYKQAIYVLHAFQKKSTQGIRTSLRDIDTIANRLRRAQQDYEQRYASKKNR